MKIMEKDNEDSLGRYNFKKIRYDFYRDQNVALEAFLSGEFDINIENDSLDGKFLSPKLKNRIIKKLS